MRSTRTAAHRTAGNGGANERGGQEDTRQDDGRAAGRPHGARRAARRSPPRRFHPERVAVYVRACVAVCWPDRSATAPPADPARQGGERETARWLFTGGGRGRRMDRRRPLVARPLHRRIAVLGVRRRPTAMRATDEKATTDAQRRARRGTTRGSLRDAVQHGGTRGDISDEAESKGEASLPERATKATSQVMREASDPDRHWLAARVSACVCLLPTPLLACFPAIGAGRCGGLCSVARRDCRASLLTRRRRDADRGEQPHAERPWEVLQSGAEARMRTQCD